MDRALLILFVLGGAIGGRIAFRKATYRRTAARVENGVTVVRLARDALRANKDRGATGRYLSQLVEDGAENILVDLSLSEGSADDGCMAPLVNFYWMHKELGRGVFAIACPPGRAKRINGLCEFEFLFPIADSVVDAMKFFNRGSEE